MPVQYDREQEKEQEQQQVSQELAQLLETFLSPLLFVLDKKLDKRLVRTLVQGCVAIVRFRNSMQGLLLSELGAYMDNYRGLSANAAAGTKRLGNLIRSLKWSIADVDRYLLEEADKEVQRLKSQGKRIICPFDDSVLEKPESEKGEGLCPVLSSKAKRRNRSRKGVVFNFPVQKPIRVTGMQWTAALITGMEGPVKVAAMCWWSTKGDYATHLREQQEKMLRMLVRKWGKLVIYVFDRGFASGPWLRVLQALGVRFVIRWIKKHVFITVLGQEKKLWQILLGKKYRSHKLVRDSHTGEKMPADLIWTPVRHANYAFQLYLVKVRVKKQIWYLITNEPIKTDEDAWSIFFSYKRRWQIETSFRYEKSELGVESPRIWSLENRLKLLGMVSLVYAFLLHLVNPEHRNMVESVLNLQCHRTGTWQQAVQVPLYRLRWAMSRLWERSRPTLGTLFAPDVQTFQALVPLRC
jgi:Transposase DDE domain